jgi:hypothetical protein
MANVNWDPTVTDCLIQRTAASAATTDRSHFSEHSHGFRPIAHAMPFWQRSNTQDGFRVVATSICRNSSIAPITIS